MSDEVTRNPSKPDSYEYLACNLVFMVNEQTKWTVIKYNG